jgi:hypothetical protein
MRWSFEGKRKVVRTIMFKNKIFKLSFFSIELALTELRVNMNLQTYLHHDKQKKKQESSLEKHKKISTFFITVKISKMLTKQS